MLLGEIAYLFPWIFIVLVLALTKVWRQREGERKFFLFCLALPPIVLFTLTPLWGARGLPQWTMPGWFFAYPLLGAWIDERANSPGALWRWATISGGTADRRCRALRPAGRDGLPFAAAAAAARGADPTLESFPWTGLRSAPLLDPLPAFVLSTHWSDAGKIALALGPGVPVFVISNDPRGWAYAPDGGASLDATACSLRVRRRLPWRAWRRRGSV